MAPLPPITSALIPILAGMETSLAPLLGAYIPALDFIRQILENIIPLLLGVHAVDSFRFALTWLSGKSVKSFKPFSAMLPPLSFTLPNAKAARNDPVFMENVFNPGFTNTLSFASSVLKAIDTSASLYG